jgi:hypothetical protein
MGDEARGRRLAARVARVSHVGGGDRPPQLHETAIAVEDVGTGRIVELLHMPRRVAELQRDLPDYRKLPYTFRRIDLTVASAADLEIDFEGSYFMVMRLAGVVGAGAEFRVKFNTEGREWISIRDEIVLPMAFDKLYFQWDAIANGEIDILMGTRTP